MMKHVQSQWSKKKAGSSNLSFSPPENWSQRGHLVDSKLDLMIGSQRGPNKMAAAHFLWLHFLNNRSSIQSFIFWDHHLTQSWFLLYDKLRERAVCGEFCVLTGYPSGQVGAILPARDCPFRSRKKKFAKIQASTRKSSFAETIFC